MLKIDNLCVNIKNSDKNIINDLNLVINEGETHAIMGPNGTGKSTLAKSIMGHYLYSITKGSIIYNGKELNNLDVADRAKLGIFLAMQDSMQVEGVSNSEFLKTAKEEVTGKHIEYFPFISSVNNSLKDLEFDKDFVHRNLNVGFSGGEKKKNEILQIKVLEPSFIILDEIDSGLDIDSLKIVAKNICDYKEKYPKTSILIITHYPRILEYIKPDYVHIMMNGTITKTGDMSLALEVEQVGYNE